MKRNLKKALKYVLVHEGGWANHPKDPGGATMKGVTLATYRRHFGEDKSKDDLRNIADEELEQIYRWGMHLTPEAPRSSIRALEDYSRTLGSFKSASPSGFKVNRCRPPAGRNERRL